MVQGDGGVGVGDGHAAEGLAYAGASYGFEVELEHGQDLGGVGEGAAQQCGVEPADLGGGDGVGGALVELFDGDAVLVGHACGGGFEQAFPGGEVVLGGAFGDVGFAVDGAVGEAAAAVAGEHGDGGVAEECASGAASCRGVVVVLWCACHG